ncbi:UNVERIFIED_ORG: type 1 fimbria pilin [Buttiauxella agrestis ATCC 33320]
MSRASMLLGLATFFCGSIALNVLAGGNVGMSFTGTITDVTCDISEDSQNQTVNMGDFSTGSFPDVGSTTDSKSFEIKFKNCSDNITGAKMKFSGVQDKNDPTLLALSGSSPEYASGVGIEILDESHTVIPINTISQGFPMVPENNTLMFFLRYKSTMSVVTAGSANSLMYFDVTYQ